eukprot:1151755-Pelagomonas_calceolata.AAC.3
MCQGVIINPAAVLPLMQYQPGQAGPPPGTKVKKCLSLLVLCSHANTEATHIKQQQQLMQVACSSAVNTHTGSSPTSK